MGRKRKAVIQDAPVLLRTSEQDYIDLSMQIIQQIKTMNALKKLFVTDGPYAAIPVDTRKIQGIFEKYTQLMDMRRRLLQGFHLLLLWIEDKKPLSPEELTRVIAWSAKYKCMSRQELFRQILAFDVKIAFRLERWIKKINARPAEESQPQAKKEAVVHAKSPLFTQVDNRSEPSEQFMAAIDMEIHNSDAVMQFADKLLRFQESIGKLPGNFPSKKELMDFRQGLEKAFDALLATVSDIRFIQDKLAWFSDQIDEREKMIAQQCKPQNIKFLSLVDALNQKLSSLANFNPSVAVSRMQHQLMHLKKPRHNEDIIWLEWAVLEQMRLDINTEIRKNHLEMQRRKDIAQDCEEINRIIVKIAAERTRIQQKSPVYLNNDARINILNNLQDSLTRNIQRYADPAEKKSFILSVIDSFDTCLNPKILQDLTNVIAHPFLVFIRSLLEPVYQLLKSWCGAKYMPHFFCGKTENNMAAIAQNAEYRMYEILARLEDGSEECCPLFERSEV